MMATLAAVVLAATSPSLERVLADTPADSLAAPLRALEQRLGRSQEAGEVALELGGFHFARGEYRQAAETLARAAARLEPSRKPEARYWQGLSQLALQQSTEARVTLEEVARTSQALRPAAMLGISWAWEQAGRPDRALDTLEDLVDGKPGESGPAALERIATLASGLGRSDLVRRATARLVREYPGSVEAARSRGSERPR
jgi:tetratricopeptide (TPR) repeat protein